MSRPSHGRPKRNVGGAAAFICYNDEQETWVRRIVWSPVMQIIEQVPYHLRERQASC